MKKKLICQNCKYEWEYGGKSKLYCSCPRCRYIVNVKKQINNTTTNGLSEEEERYFNGGKNDANNI